MITEKSKEERGLSPYLSPLAVLALSFGYAVGWGSFVLPGTFFLPTAGPLGSVIGITVGGLAMCIIAWGYHLLAFRAGGPGGAFKSTQRLFGSDHGFLVAWFLFLTYIAVLWANATSMVLLARFTLGDIFQFGFHYTLAGFDVYFGESLLPMAAIIIACAICMSGKRLAANFQTALAIVFAGSVAVLLGAALLKHQGGLAAAGPAFAPTGKAVLSQIFAVIAMAPWAFVGFEAVSHSAAEFRFPLKRKFWMLIAAVVLSTAVYISLMLLPAIALPEGYASWHDYVKASPGLDGIMQVPVFGAAKTALGNAGVALVIAAMLAGQFTGIVATLIATSRLMYAMSHDGILPKWFGRLDADSSPRNAIFFVSATSLGISLLGRTVVGWPVDVSSIGAAIAYGYTSAAAYKVARSRWQRALGLCGGAMAVVFALLLLVPNYLSGSVMAAESYLVLAIWCILVFMCYRIVYLRDRESRYGQSTVVWISLIVLIIFSSLMWIRQATYNATMQVVDKVMMSEHGIDALPAEMDDLNEAMVGHSLIDMCLLFLALAVMLSLFTVLRRREQSMAVAKAKAEEVNKAKSYFFSTVSHDIRTPLNAIIGFSQMLKHGFKTKAEHDEAVDSILVSSETLLNLINDVLDLSKLESGRMTIDPEPTDCTSLLREIVKSFRVSNKRPEQVEIRGNIPDMPLLLIDPQRVRQIAFNLVGNAVKFTNEGHVEVRAEFRPNPDGLSGLLLISVEDTGCGISREDLKKIDSPYVQVGSKAARNGGTGLGLAICRQLAFAMGGKPMVQSTLGKGSTFSLLLPSVEVCDTPPAEAAAKDSGDEIKKPAARLLPGSRKGRILLVDDQKMNLMVLKAMLGKIGNFDLTMAHDGKEALAALEAGGRGRFDLVLTDMWMPEMNGEELLHHIRANPKFKDLPVYVITADAKERGSYEDAGFTGMLLKPVTIERLKEFLG